MASRLFSTFVLGKETNMAASVGVFHFFYHPLNLKPNNFLKALLILITEIKEIFQKIPESKFC